MDSQDTREELLSVWASNISNNMFSISVSIILDKQWTGTRIVRGQADEKTRRRCEATTPSMEMALLTVEVV